MNNIDYSKQIIRKEYFLKRETNLQQNFHKENEKIIQNLNKILAANNQELYGLYLAMNGEPDILKLGIMNGKTIALPKIIDREMIFVKYQPGDSLEKSKFDKLSQPKSAKEVTPKVIIVPGLCFSVKGYRIGFGFGHYDKYLHKVRQFYQPIVIGVCFHDNLKLSLPFGQYDQKMDYLITDQMMLKI